MNAAAVANAAVAAASAEYRAGISRVDREGDGCADGGARDGNGGDEKRGPRRGGDVRTRGEGARGSRRARGVRRRSRRLRRRQSRRQSRRVRVTRKPARAASPSVANEQRGRRGVVASPAASTAASPRRRRRSALRSSSRRSARRATRPSRLPPPLVLRARTRPDLLARLLASFPRLPSVCPRRMIRWRRSRTFPVVARRFSVSSRVRPPRELGIRGRPRRHSRAKPQTATSARAVSPDVSSDLGSSFGGKQFGRADSAGRGRGGRGDSIAGHVKGDARGRARAVDMTRRYTAKEVRSPPRGWWAAPAGRRREDGRVRHLRGSTAAPVSSTRFAAPAAGGIDIGTSTAPSAAPSRGIPSGTPSGTGTGTHAGTSGFVSAGASAAADGAPPHRLAHERRGSSLPAQSSGAATPRARRRRPRRRERAEAETFDEASRKLEGRQRTASGVLERHLQARRRDPGMSGGEGVERLLPKNPCARL